MAEEVEPDEKSSLLGSWKSKKEGSLKNPIFVPSYTNGSKSKIESVTYTWHNINVWVGAESKNSSSSSSLLNSSEFSPSTDTAPSYDEEAAGIWPWNKKSTPLSKQILTNVSGVVRPGELLAIMGASGAGKTTLLNVLTFRNTKKLRVSGERRVNGVSVELDALTALSAYVQQDDLFVGTLTVREHLIFQALLRMHEHIPYLKRMERVEEVIQEFGLLKCSETLIGIPGRIKGISGGEMKRLAFASEVLTDPLLMFCDEPTSGLDSFMAQNTITCLREMAQKGKTIVCTIHQPSSELYALFDRILFMAEGRVAFLGDTKDAVGFFSDLGHICPSHFNPADFFIETLAIQPGAENESLGRVSKICDSFENSELGKKINEMSDICSSEKTEKALFAHTQKTSPYKASWIAQFRAVLWRSWLTILREPMILRVRTLQTMITAVLLSIIYWNQDYNQDGVMNINGALFLFLTNMTFQNVFAVVNVFCNEVQIFLREHFNGMYRTDVYFLSKTIAEIPLYIIFPFLFTALTYFSIGLNYDFGKFFITAGIVVLVSNVACSFGYLVSCISSTVTVALSIAAPALIPLMIFGGFFLNQASVPFYFQWLKYLSWFMYGNEALVVNQWNSVPVIICNRSNSTCPASGDVVLDTLNFNPNGVIFDVSMLVVLLVGYRLLAYFALLAKTYRN